MKTISASNIKSKRPIILHRLAKEAWGSPEKGLLSRKLLDNVIDNVNSFTSQKLCSLSKDQLTAVLVDYLRVIGYSVKKWDYSEYHPFVTTYLNNPEKTQPVGLAIADAELSIDDINIILLQNPDLEYYHVLTLKVIRGILKKNIHIVTIENIAQLIVYIVIFDYFFDTYMYSILNMPGFKEYFNRQVKKKAKLTKEVISRFEIGWESLRDGRSLESAT